LISVAVVLTTGGDLKEAREGGSKGSQSLAKDLDVVESYVQGLIKQEYDTMSNGIAMFLCTALYASVILRSRLPFENQFSIDQYLSDKG
jgi:hypothetical protein